MGEIVVDSDCRFTLTVGLVVAGFKAELTSSTTLEASVAVLAFAVAAAYFTLAASIAALAASIFCSGFEVDPGDAVVVAAAVAVVVGAAVVPSKVEMSFLILKRPRNSRNLKTDFKRLF